VLATVERVERRQGQKGPYYLVHLGEGRKAYCWDGEVARALRPGAVYEVEVREGRFPRLLRAREVTTQDGTQEAEAQGSYRERLEALRLVLSLAQWTRLESVDQVIEAATKILAWLKEGEG